MLRGSLAITAWLALTLSSVGASAQSSADRTAADALFDEGRDALARGDAKLACEKFEKSRQLDPAVGTLLNLGDCNERLARKRLAWLSFREALRVMTPSDDRQAYARERVVALEAKLGRLVLNVVDTPTDARIVLDDEPIVAPYGVPRVVDPGRHGVRVLVSGRTEGVFVANVPEGKESTLTISPGAPIATDVATRGSSSRRTVSYVIGGVGLASLGAGGFFGIAALDSSSSARDRCGGLECGDAASLAAARSDADSASTQATLSTVFLSVGAVALVAGVYLWITSDRAGASKTGFASTLSHIEF